MPNRIIREGLLYSDKYLSLANPQDQLLFHQLLSLADDFGLCEAGYGFLKQRAPICSTKTFDQVAASLNALADVDLIRVYETDGKRFLFIPKFGNSPRAKKPKYPIPKDEKSINEINKLLKICIADAEHVNADEDHMHANAPDLPITDNRIPITKTKPPFPQKSGEDIFQSEIQKKQKPVREKNSLAVDAIVAMRGLGITDGNPQHPKLLQLVSDRATLEDFTNAAQETLDRGIAKGFAYSLRVVESALEKRKLSGVGSDFVLIKGERVKKSDLLSYRPPTETEPERWSRLIKVGLEWHIENDRGFIAADTAHPENVALWEKQHLEAEEKRAKRQAEFAAYQASQAEKKSPTQESSRA